jgi:hypothetical protein
MANSSTLLFRTIADRDYLEFGSGESFNPHRVARFLELSKSEVAKVAGVAPASVRFDQKMPKDVRDRLLEVGNICALVAQFFAGDVAKTALWFKTKNPLFGNISPRDMIRYGRYEKLRRFVMSALEENAAVEGIADRYAAGEPTRGSAEASTQ